MIQNSIPNKRAAREKSYEILTNKSAARSFKTNAARGALICVQEPLSPESSDGSADAT